MVMIQCPIRGVGIFFEKKGVERNTTGGERDGQGSQSTLDCLGLELYCQTYYEARETEMETLMCVRSARSNAPEECDVCKGRSVEVQNFKK